MTSTFPSCLRWRNTSKKVGRAAGYRVNQHNEYDVLAARHQIPGGMTGTLRAQIAKHNLSDRMDEILEETAVVREETWLPRNGNAVLATRGHSVGIEPS